MVYIVKKHNQHYRYRSVRVGNQVRSIYLGKVDPKVIEGQIKGAKKDKRDINAIVSDMKKKSKHTTTDVKKWNKSKDKIDLVGWDTKHIVTSLKKHKKIKDREMRSLRKDLKVENVEGRVKTTKSTVGKLILQNKTQDKHLSDINDLMGLRVTVKSINDIKKVSKRLEKKYDIIEKEDYIRKHNYGYRSRHYLVKTKDKMIYELQFRTPRQTRWADYAHETMYKNREKSLKTLGKKEHKKVSSWLVRLSNHYYDLDRGKKSTAPKQPKSTKKLVPMLPDYAKKDLIGPRPRWKLDTQ